MDITILIKEGCARSCSRLTGVTEQQRHKDYSKLCACESYPDFDPSHWAHETRANCDTVSKEMEDYVQGEVGPGNTQR